eukprot:c14629_g1_i2 orf=183-338(-)
MLQGVLSLTSFKGNVINHLLEFYMRLIQRMAVGDFLCEAKDLEMLIYFWAG